MRQLIRIIGIWIGLVVNHSPIFGQSKFSFSISAAPGYTYSNTNATILLPDNSITIPVDVEYQQKGVGYSVGILARYELSTHFSVSTGIWLNHNHYNQPTISTNPDLTLNPTGVQVVGESSTTRNYQIPVLVNYQSSTKRLSPYFSAGTYINFPYTKIYAEGTGTLPNQKIRIYPTLGAGIKYQLSNHLSLITQPTFTYLIPIRTYNSYQYYQLSLQTQLLYKF
ncbi:outer membrane beta-barrel protein [Spirosoma sp. HMF4905]|uniref:Outer membrane beta-barrel protein n=1 Tax=Spirosoma arboris TaxID=2682092 RepID=A0A7K1SNS0_9BACT|nr:outer membrane beta-barrel protein [Spirosoma arboris]MVM35303.1 outer membrane beta-barrel protein [Spirosoma arboris]